MKFFSVLLTCLAIGAGTRANHQQKLDPGRIDLAEIAEIEVDGVASCQCGDELRLCIGHRGDAEITDDGDARGPLSLPKQTPPT